MGSELNTKDLERCERYGIEPAAMARAKHTGERVPVKPGGAMRYSEPIEAGRPVVTRALAPSARDLAALPEAEAVEALRTMPSAERAAALRALRLNADEERLAHRFGHDPAELLASKRANLLSRAGVTL